MRNLRNFTSPNSSPLFTSLSSGSERQKKNSAQKNLNLTRHTGYLRPTEHIRPASRTNKTAPMFTIGEGWDKLHFPRPVFGHKLRRLAPTPLTNNTQGQGAGRKTRTSDSAFQGVPEKQPDLSLCSAKWSSDVLRYAQKHWEMHSVFNTTPLLS